jgi:GntR family transcriptional repressor for pyruvate dehydrogenase complex
MLRDREGTMLALLRVLAEANAPVGTRTAASALLDSYDTKLSESSTSRLLQEMDTRGWTAPVAAKGRILTSEGRRRHEELVLSVQASATLTDAVTVRNVQDLLELLHARKAVESALAADAAMRATDEDVQILEVLLQAQSEATTAPSKDDPVGLHFHRRIADMAGNSMLKVLAGIVLAPQLNHVEELMDIILGTHQQESSVLGQHQAVITAIGARDATAAEAAMDAHFEQMISEAEQFLVGRNADVVARLLEFMESRSLASRPS